MTMGHHLKSEVSSFEQVQTLPLRRSNSAPAEPCPMDMPHRRCVALDCPEFFQQVVSRQS